MFFFTIQPKFGVKPYGFGYVFGNPNEQNPSRDYLMIGDSYRSSLSGGGVYCSGVILMDGWKISDDYLGNLL